MSNYEIIKGFTAEKMAMFLRMAGLHIGGWSYQELLEWLSEPDNISKDMTDKRLEFYEVHG